AFSAPIKDASTASLVCNGLLEDAGVHALPSRTIAPAPTTGNACPSSNSNHAAPGMLVSSGPLPVGHERVESCAMVMPPPTVTQSPAAVAAIAVEQRDRL